jgi:DEAD/DEAH box helicase domain-containing protein
VDIRGAGEGYTIFEESSRHPIGSISGARVLAECHEGAIYLHRARQYHVARLDLEKRDVYARPVDVSYYTRPIGHKETEILSVARTRKMARFHLRQGRLKVTSWITGYETRRIYGQDLLSAHELTLPPSTFETIGIWVEIDDALKRALEQEGRHYMGAIHAMEHANISLFPLFALCDRNDIGGISYPQHPQVGRSAVFFYDGHPGGVGLCASVFDILDRMLRTTLDLIAACPCENGCPSCVHSPKCGSGNRPIDKAGARRLLELLLEDRPLAPALADPDSDTLIREKEMPTAPETAPAPERRVIFFDLETQRSAEEVGGWQNAHLMRLAVAVLYDSREKRFEHFKEGDVHRLLARLREADLVVGFNLLRFDYAVLRGYAREPLDDLPTFDLLLDLHQKLGYRLSLGHLAEQTLGASKSADGLDSLRWWREGKIDQVADYCERDVEITRRLFEHGAREKHVLFETKEGRRVRLRVSWEIEEILKSLAPPPPAVGAGVRSGRARA